MINYLSSTEEIIESLYKNLLKRSSGDTERSFWVNRLEETDFDVVLQGFLSSDEYRKINGSDLAHLPGHFYSPVVNIDEIDREKLLYSDLAQSDLDLIGIAPDKMLDFWRDNEKMITSENFSEDCSPFDRYYYNNPVFCRSDASVLRAMLLINKPRNIVEIGSGFSSAVMLDTIDKMEMNVESIVFIDPFPERLQSLLKLQTNAPYKILVAPVQQVCNSYFTHLGPGDILFIDSSHVLKAQSDVCHELFSILPLLSPGVIIHFHDIFYPFEYPADWLLNRKYSWNEIYALRAFLMYNKSFEIVFFNNFFFKKHLKVSSEATQCYGENPGGSLWVRKLS